MTIQEEIQQLTEHWLSIFAGLVRSGQLYSVDVQAKLLLSKLQAKGVVIQVDTFVDVSPHKMPPLPILEPLIEVKDV